MAYVDLVCAQLADDELLLQAQLLAARGDVAALRDALHLALNGWHHARAGREAAEQRLRQIMGTERWHPEERRE